MDGLGWSPIRRLKDVVWGLNALFTVRKQESMFLFLMGVRFRSYLILTTH